MESAQSAILSAVIFNALIIVGLIPLALRGVRYRAVAAADLLRRNLLIYGLGGIVAPVPRHQAHRPARGTGAVMIAFVRQLGTGIRTLAVLTVILGIALSAAGAGASAG